MNSWRWRTVLVYLVVGVVLFGTSAFFFGKQEKIDNLPTGTEVLGQASEESQKVTGDIGKTEGMEGAKDSSDSFQSEAARIKSELALVGIKSEEIPVSRAASVDRVLNDVNSKNAEAKSIKDFPSPVQAVPIKAMGNYYSESLQAYLFHAGTDYAQLEGAVIRVNHSGKVAYAGLDPILGGKVEVDCGEDWSVIYGGLENLRVKEGDQVEVNQALGQIGYYPGADEVKNQPQLHYEVWHGNEVQFPK